MPGRSCQEQQLQYLTLADEQGGSVRNTIAKGFVPNMRVPGVFYANDKLRPALLDELAGHGGGGFLPAVCQIANVATLPGIVKESIGLPDCHAGYGFAIGNVAAMDMNDPEAVVSPGGVGFDICCGVRLIRTNLMAEDITPVQERLAQHLMDGIPSGVGGRSYLSLSKKELEEILETGMAWSVKKGHATEHDRLHCEEKGRVPGGHANDVSARAKERGRDQVGTLGAGNHYCEVQKIDKIYDAEAARAMGLEREGQVCIMIHTGSRGLGHQVCSDYLMMMKSAKQPIALNDRQLMCAPIKSQIGQKYLSALACASNFAFANRSAITHAVRTAFATVMKKSSAEMGMSLIYDVAHNTAKAEKHMVNGYERDLLVHRKGATRAFPPGHPSIPDDYKEIGQPVLVGGSMGTASYVLTGTKEGMSTTWGSTCHGAGRLLSRHHARDVIKSKDTLESLKRMGVTIKVGNPKLVQEEDARSYKDVDEVVNTCEAANISKRVVRLVPMIVTKG
ncbi:RNA-splicing ligase RtcB like protein [Plasmodiophora brassicae]